ncbi:glycoside hydrolase family 43 protein [Thermoanaerobacterium sp. CMT5567-10]|uniref:glycoside hydrolase family 43 protein n=1 Tax=Thermoanaerobacterium sp. CMT5567-10 TaxID=3061989 RepID=UPI0026E0D10C|nr:glycoside hydrolase family 43 protein [Thermoanaerobacterium sp. CMT5567-10]WKV08599.1 glycoside hydrolase family 43 protein [Thermoanaerobacterium sp. CMT5567-10]
MKYKNPIIRGFNPDPSICRVGNDYYIVNSSFEFFPGIPVYHSKNLVNWQLLGYCLSRDSQLELSGAKASSGIYAPTIRYNNGIFYVTATNVYHGGNFIVYSKDPSGRWSEPIWVDQNGIDPSLFFDDDGTVYYSTTNNNKIMLSEINPLTGKRLSSIKQISEGSGGRYPEGPHIYKINEWYYLMLAEGGTEYGHMETIFRSKSPWGPYEVCPHNPILTHRNKGENPIQCVGHADLVEDQNRNWWLVCLGVRPIGNLLLHNLGRETFLAPVIWDKNGWPIAGNNGTIAIEMDGPLLSEALPDENIFYDDFENNKLDVHWNFIRNFNQARYDLSSKSSWLKISGGEETLSESKGSPAFIGRKQQHFNCTVTTKILFDPIGDNSEAGIAAYYNDSYHYEVFITKKNNDYYICLRKRIHDIEVITDCVKIEYEGKLQLRIRSDRKYYYFDYKLSEDEWKTVGKGMTAGLCTEGTYLMTFTGTYIGIYCINGEAYFDWFEYFGED